MTEAIYNFNPSLRGATLTKQSIKNSQVDCHEITSVISRNDNILPSLRGEDEAIHKIHTK